MSAIESSAVLRSLREPSKRADLSESLVRRPVHNGDELVARQELREFFISDALRREAGQQRRGDQHDPGTRLRQALILGFNLWVSGYPEAYAFRPAYA